MMAVLDIAPSSFPALVALAAIGFGLIFMVLGIVLLRQQSKRRRTWIRIRGEAYDYVWSGGGDDSTQHWRLRWTGPDGIEHRCTNPFGVSGGTLRTFPFPVELLVDPENPDRARVASGLQSGSFVSMVFTAGGGVMLVVGVGIAISVFG